MTSKTISISKAPGKVSSLANITFEKPATSTIKGSTSWKVPKSHTSDQNDARGQKLVWHWEMVKFPGTTDDTKERETERLVTRDRAAISNTSCNTGSIDRTKYYPFTAKVNKTVYKKNKDGSYKTDSQGHKIPETKKVNGQTVNVTKRVDEVYPIVESMKFDICEWNNVKGNGPKCTKTHVFEKPETPTVTFDLEEGNVLKITIKSKSGSKKERHDVVYHVLRKDTNTGSTRYDGTKWVTALSYPGGTELKAGAVKPYAVGSTSEETVLRHDLNYSQLPTYAQVEVKVVCYARGLRGNSSHAGGEPKAIVWKDAGMVWKDADYPGVTYVFAGPKRPIINSIQVTKGTSAPNDDNGYSVRHIGLGQVLVGYEVAGKSSAAEYVKAPTSVKLYRTIVPESVDTVQKMLEYAGASWTEVDSDNGVFSSTKKAKDVENEGCMGEPCSAVISSFTARSVTGMYYGERVYYKITATRQGISLDSAPMEAKKFYVPTPSMRNDKCEFLLMESGVDGTSIDLQVGWNDGESDQEMIDLYPEGTYDTEISWAEDSRAWHSNKSPDSGTITWENDETQHLDVMDASPVATTDWLSSADFSIMDLEPGKSYYVQGRRHVKMDDIDEYGPYCQPADVYWPFTVFRLAGSISVNIPDHIVYNGTLPVSWSIDSQDLQKSWCVYAGVNPFPQTQVAPTSLGEGYTTDATSVELDFADLLNKGVISEVHTLLYVAVGVSIDGTTTVRSDQAVSTDGTITLHKVNIIHPPQGGIAIPETVAEQPAAFLIFSKTNDVEAPVCIRSEGIDMLFPDGMEYQAEGDYIWETTIGQSDWMASASAVSRYTNDYHWDMDSDLTALKNSYDYAAIVTPAICQNLYDGCRYTVEYTIRNADYKELLFVPDTYPTFVTDYTHKAEPPGLRSIVTSRVKDDGSPYVEILCYPPSNLDPDDVCDIYRVTPDGAVVVATDVPFGSTVTDNYPPFGKRPRTYYTLMTRTRDGSYAYRDVPYHIPKFGTRFDWGYGQSAQFLELPYNVSLSDSFSKDVEVRSHMSGKRSAFFNKAVQHTASASVAEPITLEHIDPVQFEKLRAMAQYPGLVLFRADNGVCYNAVVNVDDIPYSYDSLISTITMSLEIVDLTDQYMIDTSNALEMLGCITEDVT